MMFEHFTFGAQAQTSHLQLDDVSASPTDCSFPLTSPPPTSYFPYHQSNTQIGGISDIVNKFSQQTLYPEEQPYRSIWNEGSIPSPDFEIDSIDDEFTPEEMTYVSTRHGMVSIPSSISSTQSLPNLPHPRGGTIAYRRLQRQLNVQLQSCNNHIKDINTLVEDMIASNSQCRLHKSTSRPYLASPPPSGPEVDDLLLDTTEFEGREISPDEDEGFSEMDDPFGILALEEEMSLRRASTPSGIRKYNVIRWRKSAECVGSSGPGVVRTKVRSVPRMRRRKVDTVPE